MMTRDLLFVGLLCVSLISVVHAEETTNPDGVMEGLPSRVTLDGGRSSSDSRSFSLDTDIGLSNEGRLQVGLGTSRYSSSVGVLQTNTIRAGYQTDPLEEWSFGGSFENWGAFQKLTSNSLRGAVIWTPSVWELSLDPEFKSYNWFVPAHNNRRLRSAGMALHMRVVYYGIKKFSLSLSAGSYSYSDRMESILDSGYFYEEALDLAAGFPKSYVGLSAGYRFGWLSTNLGYSVTRYQFIDGDSKTGTIRLSADIQKKWSVSVEAGSSQSDGAKSNFSSVAVSYFWQ